MRAPRYKDRNVFGMAKAAIIRRICSSGKISICVTSVNVCKKQSIFIAS